MSSSIAFILVSIVLALLLILLAKLLTNSSTQSWQTVKQGINRSLEKQWEVVEVIGQELGLISQTHNEELFLILREFPEFELNKTRTSIPYVLAGRANEFDFWILCFGSAESYSNPDSISTTFQGFIYLLIQSDSLRIPTFSLYSFILIPFILLPFSKSIRLKKFPRFSRKYQLKGKCRQSIEALFGSRLVKFLISKPRSLSLRGSGNLLLYGKGWRNLNQISSKQSLNNIIEEGFALYNLVSSIQDQP
ncbi:MAG: hypothetical protein AAF609_20385 [Cyanobacteria bacterium P01_C01_bin.120]